ncbi:MAG: nicotinamide-nucleotide amidase [Gammaproteobacteria bacterium]
MSLTLIQLAQQLGETLTSKGWKTIVAESCTGGGLGHVITEIAGSSAWFEGGFICYSNQAKQNMLEVSAETLTHYGAVSEATAREMAQGALTHSAHSQISAATTGIAGPGGATAEKPVGMVCFAWAVQLPNQSIADTFHTITDTQYFQGDRQQIRHLATIHALQGLIKFASSDLFSI